MGQQENQGRLIHYDKVDSTNRIAYDLADKGAAHGTIVVANTQSGGRGRKSRQFISPRGGLYISVVLRTTMPAERLSFITLAAAVACADTIGEAGKLEVQVKWPNDIYCQGKKMGGILAEAAPFSHAENRIPFVVVGIGLNINTRMESLPPALHDCVASLYSLTNREYDMSALLHLLRDRLLAEAALLEELPEDILARWRQRDYLLGRRISWMDPAGRRVEGIAQGLLPDGRYRLTGSGGEEYSVMAGDITIGQMRE